MIVNIHKDFIKSIVSFLISNMAFDFAKIKKNINCVITIQGEN